MNIEKVKMKTKKSAAKRLKKTAHGIVKVSSKGKSHCLSNKNRKRKRRLLQCNYLRGVRASNASLLIPYI